MRIQRSSGQFADGCDIGTPGSSCPRTRWQVWQLAHHHLRRSASQASGGASASSPVYAAFRIGVGSDIGRAMGRRNVGDECAARIPRPRPGAIDLSRGRCLWLVASPPRCGRASCIAGSSTAGAVAGSACAYDDAAARVAGCAIVASCRAA